MDGSPVRGVGSAFPENASLVPSTSISCLRDPVPLSSLGVSIHVPIPHIHTHIIKTKLKVRF